MKYSSHEENSYSSVAKEYYDSQRHPTSANFRELGLSIICHHIMRISSDLADILEVGAGKSVFFEDSIMKIKAKNNINVTVSDSVDEMLKNNCTLNSSHGVRLLKSNAKNLSVDDIAFDLIISNLGDPYNTPRFWRECSRVLRPGGYVTFTTPTHEWSQRFRSQEGYPLKKAEFKLRSGRMVFLPSYTRTIDAQIRMVRRWGFQPISIEYRSVHDIANTSISPKLLGIPQYFPVIAGLLVRKS